MNRFIFSRHEASGTWMMECNDTTLAQGALEEVDAMASRLSRAGLLPRGEFEAFRQGAGIKDHPIFGVRYPGQTSRQMSQEAWSQIVD